jgi:hypothetical protein
MKTRKPLPSESFLRALAAVGDEYRKRGDDRRALPLSEAFVAARDLKLESLADWPLVDFEEPQRGPSIDTDLRVPLDVVARTAAQLRWMAERCGKGPYWVPASDDAAVLAAPELLSMMVQAGQRVVDDSVEGAIEYDEDRPRYSHAVPAVDAGDVWTRRDELAIESFEMLGRMLAARGWAAQWDAGDVAQRAYALADAMLLERRTVR